MEGSHADPSLRMITYLRPLRLHVLTYPTRGNGGGLIKVLNRDLIPYILNGV